MEYSLLQRSLTFNTIIMSREGPMVRVILNRPRVGNRVNRGMVEELARVTDLINQDDSVRVVTLIGRGRAFSSGWERLRIDSAREMPQYQAAAAIAQIQKPVVAAVNGDAIGQGLELALAADIRIATATARFCMPQVHYGIVPWDGGTQRLPRVVGRAHALTLLLTGATVDAREALRMGLVNRVVEPDEFDGEVDGVAGRIAAAAPVAGRYVKETVMKGMDITLDQALRLEADLNILLHTTSDRSEGIHSFLERRSPRFSGQ